MKKINLFNRNTNLPSYRRRPVSRGFNRGGGIPLFSGMTKKICHKFPSREGWRVAPAGVWFAALVALFIATPSFATPTELDKKTVASKAYVDTKQDKIETGLVEYTGDSGEPINLPTLVSYDATDGLTANKIAFINLSNTNASETPFEDLPGNFIPTADLISELLSKRQLKLPAAYTSTSSITLMGAKGGQTIELNTLGNIKRRYITAGGNEALTLKSGGDNVILYVNGTKTVEEFQTSNFGGTGNNATTNQNHIKKALVSLELLKDVYSELDSKITNNALPTGTTGTVVTYNGTNATTGLQEFGERAVYDPANAYNAQNDATKLATAGFVETKQNKMVCAGWDSDTHTDEHCWLWSIE